jgi:hypothetical protein
MSKLGQRMDHDPHAEESPEYYEIGKKTFTKEDVIEIIEHITINELSREDGIEYINKVWLL